MNTKELVIFLVLFCMVLSVPFLMGVCAMYKERIVYLESEIAKRDALMERQRQEIASLTRELNDLKYPERQ